MKLRFVFLLVCLLFAFASPAAAAEPVRFTITARSAIIRSGPGTSYTLLKTASRNQIFTVTGRTADSTWLRVSVPRLKAEAWIFASLGRVRGSLNSIPVVTTTAPLTAPAATAAPANISPTPAPVTASFSTTGPTNPVIAAATSRAREIFQAGLSLGNNPRAFSKIGDCQSVTPYFMAAFDTPGQYGLGQYAYMQDTIDNFRGSFSRDGLAAMNGFNTAGVLSPLWANSKVCNKGESPLECEYRLNRPSIAIISLGTNGAWQSDGDYETGLRRIIEISIQRGVVPILSTKADNVEGGGRFNLIMAKLAAEYDIPLWNFWLAASALPNFGIVDQYHLSWGRSFFDDSISMSHGWAWRNLTALQSLAAVWKGVR
jgi:uncharacterized protein YraI